MAEGKERRVQVAEVISALFLATRYLRTQRDPLSALPSGLVGPMAEADVSAYREATSLCVE